MSRHLLKQAFSMASAPALAPFSRAVVNSMRKLYPEQLADKSWDNTGLLLEAPFNASRRQNNSVLLTVDLTKAVADEAIERKASIVVAYHPIIFRGLKSITLADTQQQSLLRLAAEGISVYSPHTAIDAAAGGLGDWLADIVTGEPADAQQDADKGLTEQTDGKAVRPSQPAKRPVYMLQHHPSQLDVQNADLKLASKSHDRSPIVPVNHPDHPGAGMGRIVRFSQPQPLTSIIERIGRGLGNPKGFQLAIPQRTNITDHQISSVGICAGSGGSLFKNLDADLLFTGELSHHEALAAIEKGQCVICLFHSNTERGYLHSVLREKLEEQVKEEWATIRKESAEDSSLQKALQDEDVVIEVSEVDRDPYGILISRDELGGCA